MTASFYILSSSLLSNSTLRHTIGYNMYLNKPVNHGYINIFLIGVLQTRNLWDSAIFSSMKKVVYNADL